jgi:hypothetical protein
LKKLIHILLLIGFVTATTISCKKSKDARNLEKEINDTRWELDYVLDADGNDITAQVLADSVICECFEFYKADKDPVTYNTYISKCHGTYFPDYKGNWIVADWKKIYKNIKKQNLETATIIARWTKFTVSIGNVGLESEKGILYLKNMKFDMFENSIIHKVLKLDNTGFPSDTILEYRYYKKIS